MREKGEERVWRGWEEIEKRVTLFVCNAVCRVSEMAESLHGFGCCLSFAGVLVST